MNLVYGDILTYLYCVVDHILWIILSMHVRVDCHSHENVGNTVPLKRVLNCVCIYIIIFLISNV